MSDVVSAENRSAEERKGFQQQLVTLTARLNELRTLLEPPCTSRVPVLGPLVVAGRRLWNWMFTQWYARPLLEQQNRFNEQTVRALDDVADLLMRLRREREGWASSRLADLAATAAEQAGLAVPGESLSAPLPPPEDELEALFPRGITDEAKHRELRAQLNFAALRVPTVDANRRLNEVVQEINEAGGDYHYLDFGADLVMVGIYDMTRYLHYYHLPADLSNKHVLDVGTASGYFALECARRGAKVIAIDVQEAPPFSRLLPFLNADVTYVQKSVYDLDPSWGQFDLVICGSLLCHLPDPLGALRKIRSVCCGEAIIATVCTYDSPTTPRRVCEFHNVKAIEGEFWNYWDISAPALRDMLLAAGFSEVRNIEHYTLANEPRRLKGLTYHVAMTGVV